MYLASKYEDVVPINSFIACEKISHRCIPQSEILKMEKDFLRLFDFQLDLVTPFDFHMYIVEQIKRHYEEGCMRKNREEEGIINKAEELSLFLIRMALENVDYCKYEPSLLSASALYASLAILRSNRVYTNDSFYVSLTKSLLIASKKQYKLEEVERVGKGLIEF